VEPVGVHVKGGRGTRPLKGLVSPLFYFWGFYADTAITSAKEFALGMGILSSRKPLI
jgi:hypothetical protein